jgi:hypothetical protein
MTKFDKDFFEFDGERLLYWPRGLHRGKSKLIRKWDKWVPKPWKSWRNFIIKNFTVEEFFTKRPSLKGQMRRMHSKGFLEPQQKRQCTLAGYPNTPEGYSQMLVDQVYALVGGR